MATAATRDQSISSATITTENVVAGLTNPPMVPRGVPHASILAASSYVVSANLLRQVIADLEAGEGILFDASDVASRPRVGRLVDALNMLLALPRALIFTARVRSTLLRVGAGPVERNRIALAGFVHGLHRSAARAILKKVRPKCLVIGNGNRPLELSLWAEAERRASPPFFCLMPRST